VVKLPPSDAVRKQKKNILEDIFSSILSQFKTYHPPGNLRFHYLGIFQGLKLPISMEKILSIYLKQNFTLNTLGCYGLLLMILRVEAGWNRRAGKCNLEKESEAVLIESCAAFSAAGNYKSVNVRSKCMHFSTSQPSKYEGDANRSEQNAIERNTMQILKGGTRVPLIVTERTTNSSRHTAGNLTEVNRG